MPAAQVCSLLLSQVSPSCQILCCKAINLLATHILGADMGEHESQVKEVV
jgi:hypothetical protein